MIKKLFLCFLFLFICLNIFSKQSKKNVVRIDIIGKNANRSYFIKFSDENNLNSFEAYDEDN